MSEPPKRTYTQEEVTEILKRALRQQGLRDQTLSHDELVQMADEVGIDRESLEAATTDLAQSRAEELRESDEARELAEERARRFSRFVSSLLTYLIVGAVLYFIDKRTSGGTWFYWPVMGFALALAFQLRGIFFPQEGLERRRRREEKHRRKLEKKALRDAWQQRVYASLGAAPLDRANQGAKEFESAVQAGVAALLTVAARKIEAHANRATEREGRGEVRRRQR